MPRLAREWDAIVVGAGVIGCAVGRELARRGARTAILESRMAGGGATQASAGVLAPYIEAPAGGPLHDLTVRSLALYDGFIAELEQNTGLSVEYRRCGTLEIAIDSHAAGRLASMEQWVRAAGVEARWLDAKETAVLEPALGPSQGGLLVPAHGYVRAGQLTTALLEAASRHGAVFLAGHTVERIAHNGDGVHVTVGGETHRTATVVVAAGSWSGRVASDAPPVKPIRGQLLHLRWNGPRITRVLWSESCYIVPWLDKTVLVGATVEDVGFDERATAGGVSALLQAACGLLPEAADATFVEARAGLRPATPDGLPIIGRSHEHPALVYATGHYRNGILLAPLTGELVTELLVSGRPPELMVPFTPDRFDRRTSA